MIHSWTWADDAMVALSEHDRRMDVVDEISTQWGFGDRDDDKVWIGWDVPVTRFCFSTTAAV